MHSAPLKIHNYFGIEVVALMLLSLQYIIFKLGLKTPVIAREHCSWRMSSAATVTVHTTSCQATPGIYMEVARLIPFNSLTVEAMHLYCLAAFCNIRCPFQIWVTMSQSSHSLQCMNRAESCVCTCNHCYLAGSSDENYIRHWIQDVTNLGYR